MTGRNRLDLRRIEDLLEPVPLPSAVPRDVVGRFVESGRELGASRHVERLGCDARIAAVEAAVVDERVRKRHDVGVHPVLVGERDRRLGVGLVQEPEEGRLEPALASGGVFDLIEAPAEASSVTVVPCGREQDSEQQEERTSGGS